MAERTEYAVFRFVDQNGYCHMVSDYVKGRTVMQYVKEGKSVSKQRFWKWCADLLHQLEQYYKWEEDKAYGGVNPYAVIVADDGGIKLLDVVDSDSQELVKRMQKKNVRVLFVRWEHVLARKADRGDDSYGLGKTFQFMAEKCHIEPAFTRKEERNFRKMISRCLDGKAADVRGLKELQKDVRALGDVKAGGKEEEPRRRGKGSGASEKKRVKLLWAIAVSVILTVGIVWGRGEGADDEASKRKAFSEADSGGEVNEEISGSSDVTWEARLWLELGLIYCGEMEEYGRGMGYLERAAETFPLAEAYRTMEIYLQKGGDENQVKRELERAVETGRKELESEKEWIEGKEYRYMLPFLEAYRILDTEEAWQKAAEEAEKLKEMESWREGKEAGKKEQTIEEYLAKAYEVLEQPEKAAAEYERVKELESDEAALEVLYLKLEDLYEELKDGENAWKICRESVEKVPGSERLWVRYIEKHLRDGGIEKAVCEEAVKKGIKASPELAQNAEFQKLATEYEIRIEGEEVWIGK